jgi:leucyl/phenylalanyl-tRNA--protein transferase
LIPWLDGATPFPPIKNALADPPGLLAIGADLRPARLVDAYRHAIFPWFSDDQPILWWSPDPRMVLELDEFHVSHSLRKRLAGLKSPTGAIEVRCDTCFESVMRACAKPRPGQPGTWISNAIIDAYVELHRVGYAHSVETFIDGELAGGLYGVAIGRMFFGESMFSYRTDASKIALACLVFWLRDQQFPMIDCQQQTAHLASLGARPIRREIFAERLLHLVDLPAPHAWPARLDGIAVSALLRMSRK